MRVLNDWFKAVRADGLVLVRTRVAAPWGFAVEAGDDVVFHFVAEGCAFLRGPEAQALELKAGELVLFPRGDAHKVIHSPWGKAAPLDVFLAQRNGVVDSDRTATTLVCGQFDIERHLALPALRALPPIVHLRNVAEAGRSALGDVLRMLQDEVETANFGCEIVVRNLLSTLFVHFIRDWATDTTREATDWFAAVRAPHMARALACIHETPQRAWTLEELAREAGVSRATFIRHFNASVGESPHDYLTRWRMGIAAQLLEQTDLRLGEIAARVGYESEFSFSRAFKRARGVAPVRFRNATARVPRRR
jgi:AraC family transcriptional activator of mtrCDE